MRKDSLIVSVDRVEGENVVLESDDGRTFEVPVKSFMERPTEGMIYRVPLGKQPQWAKATPDHEATAQRKADFQRRIENLKRHDRGGDIDL